MRSDSSAAFPSCRGGRLPPPCLGGWSSGAGKVAAPGPHPPVPSPLFRPPLPGARRRLRATSSAPSWTEARPEGLGRARPPPRGPAAASTARRGRQVSPPRPRAATRTPRSRNASLLGSKQLLLWSQPPLSTCGGRRQGGLFQATIPHLFLLSCEKARPPPHSERNPYFPFESPSLGAPVDVRARPSVFSSGRLPGPHSSGREAGRP